MGDKKPTAGGTQPPSRQIADEATILEVTSLTAEDAVLEIDDTANETLDALFNGQIKLYQSRSGYRVSLDGLLLANFVKIAARDKIVDLGAGNGAVALMLAYLYPTTRLTALEIQPGLLARARRNAILNRVEGRLSIIAGDVRSDETLEDLENHDVAVCNPPYRSPFTGRVSADAEKRIARHEVKGAVEHFLRAGRNCLVKKGRMALVYPAFRCVDLLVSMRTAGMEPKRLRMVHSRSDSDASLVLVEGVKGGKSHLVVESPLIVYRDNGQYSSEVAAMIRGETGDQPR